METTEQNDDSLIELDNPRCPKCKHYNALIAGVCRDCGHDVHAETVSALELDTVDVKDPKCRRCDQRKPVDVNGFCEDCFRAISPAPEHQTAIGIGGALTDIAEQASADANAFNANAVANGRATFGVGFNSAEGYVETLRRGVTQATLTEYANTLRSRYGYTVSVAVEDGRYAVRLSMTGKKSELIDAPLMQLAVGATDKPDTPEQRAIEEQNTRAMQEISRRARERKARAKASENAAKATTAALSVEGSEDRAQVSQKLHEQNVMAVTDAKATGALFGFQGEGRMTRAQISDAWAKTGLPADWLIKSKTARAHAGRAVAVIQRNGIQVFPEKKGEREAEEKKTGEAAGYDFAWSIGTISRRAKVGEKLGDTELVVRLTGDKLECEGNQEMAAKVIAEFERRKDEELYESTWIRDWLRDDIFKAKLDAVNYYSCGLYIPKQHRATARRITEAFSATGWGTGWVGTERRPELPLVTCTELGTGLAAGLEDEVEKRLSELTKHREDVRTKGADDVGKVAAGNYLRDLREIGKRVCAYSLMLGEQRSEALWSRLKDAMAEVEQLVDDPIIQRFQLIREEIERDRRMEGGVIGEEEEDGDAE